MFGIKPENRAWVDRRCRPQPLATFECPALLTGEHAKVARCANTPGWRSVVLPSSHDVMVGMPQELAAELVRAT